MVGKKAMNLFGWLEEITQYKSPIDKFTEDDWKTFQPYMIHKYLSMNSEYIELVNYIQKYSNSTKQQIYTMYKNLIPQKKVYLKWVGKKKKSNNTELVMKLSQYFLVSKREVIDYLDILNKNDIKNILTSMGEDDKEIKKLLKK
jgi:hypothetical protein